MSKFLVVTRGLANVIECSTQKDVSRTILKLKKKGYKKPIVYINENKVYEYESEVFYLK